MKMHLIGIHYDLSLKNMTGFRILDSDEGKFVDVPVASVIQVLQSNKATISGIEIKRGKLVGNNGTLDRYAKIVNNSLVGASTVVIIKEIGDAGYTVSDWAGVIKNFKNEDVIILANTVGIANGKVVTRADNTTFISAISGSYDKVDISQIARNINTGKNPGGQWNSEKAQEPVNKDISDAIEKAEKQVSERLAKKKELLKNPKVEETKNIPVNPIRSNSPKIALPKIQGTKADDEKLKLKDKNGVSVEQKITSALLVIRAVKPFYYSVISNIKKIPNEEMPTAGVTVDTLYYNPNFILELSMPELVFVLIHELLHLAMQHNMRKSSRYHYLWNVACDLFVNKLICEEFDTKPGDGVKQIKEDHYNVGIKFIEGGLYNESVSVESDTPEKIYEEISKNIKEQAKQQSQQGNGQGDEQGDGKGNEQGDGKGQGDGQGNVQGQGGGGQGQGQGGGQGGGQEQGQGNGADFDITEQDITFRGSKYGKNVMIDMYEDSKSSQMTDAQKQGKGRAILERARVLNKQLGQHGNQAGYLERYVDEVLAPKINWVSLLKSKLTRASQQVTTYSKPDKRFLSRGRVLPGPKKLENDTLDNVKVAIDTSGSISDQDLGIALAQIKQLLDVFKAKAEVIYWDTRVAKVAPFSDIKELVKIKPAGGGGTDVNCVFEHFESRDYKIGKKGKPSIIIVFTDGCFGPVAEKYKKYKDTIWVINGGYEFKEPFGVKAKLKMDK